MKLNIYITTDINSIKYQEGKAIVILADASNKNTMTYTHNIKANGTTASLIALSKSLAQIKPSVDEVIIHDNSTFIAQNYVRNSMYYWRDHDWKRPQGRKLACAAEWQVIFEKLIDGKKVSFEDNRNNEFTKWMEAEIKLPWEKKK